MRLKHFILILLACISSSAFAQGERYVIKQNQDWLKLDYWKNIKPGSALDFTHMGLQDAPAGKYGWLKEVDGHFEFENLPGVDQRFYGINLCFTANYLSKREVDEFIKRLTMLGYNAIRIHHHDEGWKDPENQEKLDYLLAEAIKAGIYITTDLYVSRKVAWRTVGIDKDGMMPKEAYKGFVPCNELAFKDWCEFTESFLCHVNPYTGRAYKDEPAICLIGLVNENKLSAPYRIEDFLKDPGFLAWWKEFALENPELNANPDKPAKLWSDNYKVFSKWYQIKAFKICSDYVKSLGCKALMSNDSNARNAEGMGRSSGFDYIDNHFYVDHPRFPKKSWSLPSTLPNKNPIKTGEPKALFEDFAGASDIPQLATEWSFSGPGRYRGLGGIMTGTMASLLGWDGLWRFAYAHNKVSFKEDINAKHPTTTYFDIARDPLTQASERAVICLYLRRDANPGVVEGLRLSQIGQAFQLDTLNGTLSIITPRTCGVFTPYGEMNAGPLNVYVSGVPATVWVSSLDENPIESSTRMLLVHLTDVQGEGTVYETYERTTLVKWGTGSLVEKGKADVNLTLDKPKSYSVYELDTSGKRMRKLKTSVYGNKLEFSVSTENVMGTGSIYYEIVKKK